MKIIAVCGMGIGTSILLKMTAEKALESLCVDGEVEATDILTAKHASADLILTSAELAPELEGVRAPVRVVADFMDVAGISTQIASVLDAVGGEG